MLKPRKSLFSPQEKAIARKPQVKMLFQVQEKATKELAKWFLDEFDVHGNQGRILAEEVVDRAVNAAKKEIPPTAPDVFVSEKGALESLVYRAKNLAEEMDKRNELEEILDAAQNREDALKHGI